MDGSRDVPSGDSSPQRKTSGVRNSARGSIFGDDFRDNGGETRACHTYDGDEDHDATLRHSISAMEEVNDDWSPTRKFIHGLISSQTFEQSMGVVIFLNFAFIVVETDDKARCFPEFFKREDECPYGSGPIYLILNGVMLSIYTCESVARLYVQRSTFWRSGWNQLDTFVLFTGYLEHLIGSVVSTSFLKVFRILRLVRALRIYLAFRELYLMVNGLMGAMKAIGWGAVMLIVFLTVWSIILVDFVHPVNSQIEYGERCPDCERKYESVFTSDLTLFQTIVAGDSWGMTSLPIIERAPWSMLIFLSIVVSVSLGLMNLILAVIVQRAAEAHESDMRGRANVKLDHKERNLKRLKLLCREIDLDGSGHLSLNEFILAHTNNDEFKTILDAMDVEQDELAILFDAMDVDHSGHVEFEEFCDELYRIQNRDPRTMITFTKMTLTQMKNTLEELVKTKVARLDKQMCSVKRGIDRLEQFLGSKGDEIEGKMGHTSSVAPEDDPFLESAPVEGQAGLSSTSTKADDDNVFIDRTSPAPLDGKNGPATEVDDRIKALWPQFKDVLERAKLTLAIQLQSDVRRHLDDWSNSLITQLRLDEAMDKLDAFTVCDDLKGHGDSAMGDPRLNNGTGLHPRTNSAPPMSRQGPIKALRIARSNREDSERFSDKSQTSSGAKLPVGAVPLRQNGLQGLQRENDGVYQMDGISQFDIEVPPLRGTSPSAVVRDRAFSSFPAAG